MVPSYTGLPSALQLLIVLLPQGLHTYCSLCVEHSSPVQLLLNFHGSFLKVGPLLLSLVASCSVFLPIIYDTLADSVRVFLFPCHVSAGQGKHGYSLKARVAQWVIVRGTHRL